MSPSELFDVVCIGGLVVGGVCGLVRGLSGEIARIASVVAAFLACRCVGPLWQRLCAGWGMTSAFGSAVTTMVGWIVLAVLAAWLTRLLVDKCLRVLMPQPYNSILGILFGAGAAFLVVALVSWCLAQVPVSFVRETVLAPSRVWGLTRPLFFWISP